MGNCSASPNPPSVNDGGNQINTSPNFPDFKPDIPPVLIEKKINYFHLIRNNIELQREKFIKNCDEIKLSIDEQFNCLLLLLSARQQALKDELSKDAKKKVDVWNRQLIYCENILKWLKLINIPKSMANLREVRNILNVKLTEDFEYIESGAIVFEIGEEKLNLATVAFQKPLNNLGKIIYNRDLRIMAPKFIIGERGDKEGQFCRPWGVCIDATGHIFISDRCNHRIHVFNEFGEYIFHFGREGSKPGEFNRPAGIAVNKQNHIIVSDKDNHRIQIFSFGGRLLKKFGRQGTGPIEFLYPWGVAANSRNEIAVCDSKNNRVQLFDEYGGLLKIFYGSRMGIDRPPGKLKLLDSPRDLAFRPDDSLLLTDFNNHRVLILDRNFDNFKTLGEKGSSPGKFFRPQGIACDRFGRFAVADSKNYRVQVFDALNNFIKDFGSLGSAPGQFDCPQGIALHPNGNVIVVDFKNDRVQVF